MSVLSAGIGRMTPKTDLQQIAYSSINSAAYSLNNSIYIWNMWNGLLGSTNGTTYSTRSQIGINMARENWASLFVGVYIEAAFNQNITMDVYQMWTVNTTPFDARDIYSKLLSITIPQTNFFRFSLGDGLAADGGVLGTPTPANNAHYRMAPSLACPLIGIEFTATAPSAGRFFDFAICRSS